MSAVSKTCRFTIINNAGQRASVWILRYTLRDNGDQDVYLTTHRLRKAIHASMHASGQWQIVYPPSYFEGNIKGVSPKGATRHIDKWRRPKEIKPGVTLAFRIHTLFSAVNIQHINPYDGLIEIPNAPEGKSIEIWVLFIDFSKIKAIKGVNVVSEISMIGEQKLLVVSRVTDIINPLTDVEQRVNFRFLNGKSKKDLIGPDLRAIIFGENIDDGSRIIWDCVMRLVG